MNVSKHTLLLSARDGYSKPVGTATGSIGKLKMAVVDADKKLKGLNQQQRAIEQFKKFSSQVQDTGLKLASSKRELNKLTRSHNLATAAVDENKTSLSQSRERLKTVTEAYGKNSKEVAFVRSEIKKLSREKSVAAANLKKEKTALQEAKKDTDRLTNSYSKQSRRLGELRNDLSRTGLNVNALGAEEVRLKRRTEETTRSLDKQARSLKTLGAAQNRIQGRKAKQGQLAGDAIGLAFKLSPLALAARKSISAESDFADVKKVVDFDSEEQAEAYRKQMMILAGELGGQNAQQSVAQIVTAAGQSGIEKDQLLAFADSAQRMSVAFDTSAEEAGKTLATWRAAMGLSQSQALDLADATNHLSNNMNAQAGELAAVIVREGSTALGSGLEAPEVAALSATLLAGGATEERAGTALKNITGRLTTGFAATGAQKESFTRLGFDAEELAASMQDDAKGTIIEVLRAIQSEDSKDQGAIISQIFGEEVKGAVSKLVQTLDDDKNGLISAFDKVANQADRVGSVNAEYANRADTTGHQLSRLSAKFERMMIVIGDRLMPVIDAVIPPLITVVDAVSHFAEESPKLATGLLAVGGALAVIKAGAIAFNLVKLAFGNSSDRLKISREKLSLTTAKTTRNANLASRSLSRVNAQLNAMGRRRGLRGGTGDYGSFDETRRTRRRGGRPRGKIGRLVQGLGDTVGSFVPSQGSTGGRLLSGASRAVLPLSLLASGGALASAVSTGDTKEIAGSVGTIGGGVGGASLGAAIGTAILPGVGTIIGGAIGGFAGSELGGSIADSIADWFSEDKTEKPANESVQKVAESIQPKANNIVTLSPVIHVKPSGDPAYDRAVSDQIVENIKQQITQQLFPSGDFTETSLTDGVDT
jgi:TP901 family phage tail tape measure protein